MSFFSQLIELFETLFHGSNPEVRQKQDLRKIETELKNFQPAIYKSRQLLPNFAEVIRILHEHTQALGELFSKTVDNPDVKLREKYLDILIETGFSDKSKEILENIKYENRKKEFASDISPKKIQEAQRQNMDFLLRELSSGSFSQIESVLQNLDVLVDLCKYPYSSLLREFNPDYKLNSLSENQFCSLQIEAMEQYLQDFYFLTAHFSLKASLGRAILALAYTQYSEDLSEREQNNILGHVRKISTVLTKVLNRENLLNLIRVAKNNPQYEPRVSENHENIIQKYAERKKNAFVQDTEKLEVEVQDERIEKEITELFNNESLEILGGYNQENSNVFFRSGAGSFLWITPLQVLKTFITRFYDTRVNALLNDLIVEGFFINPQYKSDFSSLIFTCSECENRIREFEESFEKDGKNNIGIMTGYLHDSHKDQNFMKTLKSMINTANLEAKNLLQKEMNYLIQLKKRLAELIPDVRRSSPEYVENIRVLFTSPRNKDSFEFLETSFSKWNIFLDIMKNYVIIGDVRDE